MSWLTFTESFKLIKQYRIPVVHTVKCMDFSCLDKEFSKMKKPVVLKISSPDIIHKTDLGLVKTGIETHMDLKKSYKEMLENISKKMPNCRIEGFILQEMMEGLELIVGSKEDETFGKVILFGMGGIYTEVFNDTSIRVLPVKEKEFEKMIKEVKIYKILKGYRGKKYNLNELKKILARTSKLVEEEDIKQLDFNPIIINEKEAKVVDWRMFR